MSRHSMIWMTCAAAVTLFGAAGLGVTYASTTTSEIDHTSLPAAPAIPATDVMAVLPSVQGPSSTSQQTAATPLTAGEALIALQSILGNVDVAKHQAILGVSGRHLNVAAASTVTELQQMDLAPQGGMAFYRFGGQQTVELVGEKDGVRLVKVHLAIVDDPLSYVEGFVDVNNHESGMVRQVDFFNPVAYGDGTFDATIRTWNFDNYIAVDVISRGTSRQVSSSAEWFDIPCQQYVWCWLMRQMWCQAQCLACRLLPPGIPITDPRRIACMLCNTACQQVVKRFCDDTCPKAASCGELRAGACEDCLFDCGLCKLRACSVLPDEEAQKAFPLVCGPLDCGFPPILP